MKSPAPTSEIIDSSANPFSNRTPNLTFYNKFKFLFPGILFIPLRILAFIILILIQYILSRIILVGVRTKKGTPPAPFVGYRTSLLNGIRSLDRAILFCFGFHKIVIKGEVPPPDKMPRIVVCNHLSPFEGSMVTYLTGAAMVSRIENLRMPVVGTIMRARQFIAVDRDGGAKGVKDEMNRRVLDTRFPPVAIFPEGTTLNGTALISFRAGAFAAKVPVLPITVKFVYKHVDPSWSGFKVGLGDVFLRMWAQWNNTMEVTVLPVYEPSAAEKDDAVMYANNVRAVMAKELNVRVTEHSLEDMLLQCEAIKNHIDPNDAVLGMDRVKRLLHMSLDDVKTVMRSFSKMDKDHNGTVSYEEFLETLGIPNSPYARETFATLVGSEEATTIDFRAFLCSTAKLSEELGTEEKIHFAFDACDINQDGKLSEEELYIFLNAASSDVTKEQAKTIFKRIDTRKCGFIDQYEFASFMRENPTWLALVHTTLKKEELSPSHARKVAKDLGRDRSVSTILHAIEDEKKGN